MGFEKFQKFNGQKIFHLKVHDKMLQSTGYRLVLLRGVSLCYKANFSTLRPSIKDLFVSPPGIESTICTQGHIKSIRQFKNIGFIDLSDGTTHHNLSVVLSDPESTFAKLHLKVGQSISVGGKWIESKGTQKFELLYNSEEEGHVLKIIGDVEDAYPIQKKSQTYQYLRGLPTLRHRTSSLASMLRLRSFMEAKFMEFFNCQSFTKVSPPMITSSDCEGAGEQFKIEPLHKKMVTVDGKDQEEQFFDKPTFLTVSSQLHLEVLALSLNRVWTLSPCFRAEDSNTNRHLSEFWMLEAEICYIDNVSQLTDFTEQMIRYVTSQLRDESSLCCSGHSEDLLQSRFKKDEVETMKSRWNTILSPHKWPSISYTEAIDIINKVKNKNRLKNRLAWGDDIQTDHEKWLAGSYFNSPVFITDYPTFQKPFYMPKSHPTIYDPERPTVACYDLILPEIGELVGGSLREHNHDYLVQEMKRRNMNVQDMEWYLSTRLNGTVPHGGFGMGFERLISYLGAMENVKDVIPFPRVPQSCNC